MSKEVVAAGRLPAQPAEVIDREQTISFTFDGKTYQAHPGDTIASALAAAGVRVLSRSFKYHRPRGLLCCAGHCPNCLVQVGDEPNVRACTETVRDGMDVRPQNAWPSLERDVMSLTGLADRFLPVGFYYKAFMRPKFLWPTYERVLRRASGLGKVKTGAISEKYDKQYLYADVVVVGGGPAGMSAAQAAAGQGAQVALFDAGSGLGGHLRYSGSSGMGALPEITSQLLALLSSTAGARPALRIYNHATVSGWFEDKWLSAQQGNRLFKIRAGAVVVATGAYEQPLVFDDNDLPGVMLSSAIERLIHLYGVVPGRRVVVITANDAGWQAAAEMQKAGLEIAAVVEQRPTAPAALVRQVTGGGAAVFWSHTILAAKGSGRVSQAIISPVDESGRLAAGERKPVDCDLIAVSVGWAPANGLLYQAGGELGYDERQAEFLPRSLPAGVYAAGRVAGSHDLALEMDEGRLAGRRAAAYAGFGETPTQDEEEQMARRKSAEPRRTSTLISVPGRKKQFLCYCEDVTREDLDTSIAEGYDSIELLKRYSTISMGPCQGKMCSANTVHLCARSNRRTIAETGTTTSRPPLAPVKLGVLAGQHMEPVQVTPVHDWHVARGAKMMVAGAWLRPEQYGDPLAEVEAVRQRVGLIDISTLGKIRLTGPGVPALLNRLYVNKWSLLAPGRVRYGLMCNDEGVVMDDGVTARVSEGEWYTTTTSSGATAIYEWMQWWMQSGWGEGVQAMNVTELYAAFNLAGPQSRTVLQGLTGDDLSGDAFPYMSLREMTLGGVPCRLLRIGFTGELSYEIHCPAGYGQQLWEAILAAGEPHGILPFGVEAQRVLRLEKGHIIIGQDTDALSDPISADMAWAVKLDKADFLGHRSLTRIAEEGPKQRLVGFKSVEPDAVPEEGLQIVEVGEDGRQQLIGWITSSRLSPTLGVAIGLCWLPGRLADQEGAAFTIRRNGELLLARVHHGPFYDPAGERLRM